jgi:hypothetical protein
LTMGEQEGVAWTNKALGEVLDRLGKQSPGLQLGWVLSLICGLEACADPTSYNEMLLRLLEELAERAVDRCLIDLEDQEAIGSIVARAGLFFCGKV